MKKPNKLYRSYYRFDRNQRVNDAWLHDTYEATFDRKSFRSRFRIIRIIHPLFTVAAFVPMVIWVLSAPHWEKYDLAVDNYIGGFKRVSQGLMCFIAGSGMVWSALGAYLIHSHHWSMALAVPAYAVLSVVLLFLSHVVLRSSERCISNYCADAHAWEDY